MQKTNGQEMTKVTFDMLKRLEKDLGIEAAVRGISKVGLIRLLLDWGIGELRAGRVHLSESEENPEGKLEREPAPVQPT